MTTIQQGLQGLTPYSAENLNWVRLQGDQAFDYHIDYWLAVLGTDISKGRADFLVKWEPEAYCHYHKHLGETTAVVLEGEHHIIEQSPTETVHKIRKVGHKVQNPPGDLHMELGGPEGSTVFFSMQNDDGNLFDFLASDGSPIRRVTVEDLATGNL